MTKNRHCAVDALAAAVPSQIDRERSTARIRSLSKGPGGLMRLADTTGTAATEHVSACEYCSDPADR